MASVTFGRGIMVVRVDSVFMSCMEDGIDTRGGHYLRICDFF
jgi:hypothetical protein